MSEKQGVISIIGGILVLSGVFGLFVIVLLVLNALFYALTTGDLSYLIVCFLSTIQFFTLSIQVSLGILISSILTIAGGLMIKVSKAE